MESQNQNPFLNQKFVGNKRTFADMTETNNISGVIPKYNDSYKFRNSAQFLPVGMEDFKYQNNLQKKRKLGENIKSRNDLKFNNKIFTQNKDSLSQCYVEQQNSYSPMFQSKSQKKDDHSNINHRTMQPQDYDFSFSEQNQNSQGRSARFQHQEDHVGPLLSHDEDQDHSSFIFVVKCVITNIQNRQNKSTNDTLIVDNFSQIFSLIKNEQHLQSSKLSMDQQYIYKQSKYSKKTKISKGQFLYSQEYVKFTQKLRVNQQVDYINEKFQILLRKIQADRTEKRQAYPYDYLYIYFRVVSRIVVTSLAEAALKKLESAFIRGQFQFLYSYKIDQEHTMYERLLKFFTKVIRSFSRRNYTPTQRLSSFRIERSRSYTREMDYRSNRDEGCSKVRCQQAQLLNERMSVRLDQCVFEIQQLKDTVREMQDTIREMQDQADYQQYKHATEIMELKNNCQCHRRQEEDEEKQRHIDDWSIVLASENRNIPQTSRQ
ncbi:hypothetical protein OXYTRIMIC_554 [Oxytricha trifallax]|uniref:Uncharacterized protein n=1 Tax=Oxytricha trifallax TaxID=1172189 RepID=A0A073HY46_9SPIT|nr:hypothetical protein OXYTRIMIC_554 [Oxytricha trifallax]